MHVHPPTLGWSTSFLSTTVLVGLLAASSVACATKSEDDAEDENSASTDDALRGSLSEEDDAFDVDSFPQRSKWIDTYGAIPASCVGKQDGERRTLFHGCWDWHSSVHAHWAVYRMDLTGTGRRPALARSIDTRLAPTAIASVTDELAADASFENPYGRSWLLHLVSEHETWNAHMGSPSSRLRALGDSTARGLLADLRRNGVNPHSQNYRSDAWTLSQVLLYGRTTQQSEITDEATQLIRTSFVRQPLPWSMTNDADTAAFMSTFWSSVYVIALAATDANEALSAIDPASIPDEALTPLPDPGNSGAHHLGINWSRAWAIKALARRVKEARGPTDPATQRLVRAYHAHVHAGRERHFRYRGDYRAYDHWVPQFAVYAITDGAGPRQQQ